MRYLLILLLISGSLYGQRVRYDSNNHHLDSIARVNMSRAIHNYTDKRVVTLWLNKTLKFTASSHFNTSAKGTKYLHEMLYDRNADVSVVDYMNVLAYDIRAKYYINKRNGVILRFFANGIQPKTNIYTLGWGFKF